MNLETFEFRIYLLNLKLLNEFRAFELTPTSSTCIHTFIICVSSFCFILFIFVHVWYCECVIKCSLMILLDSTYDLRRK